MLSTLRNLAVVAVALLLLPPTARAAGEGSIAISLDCHPVRGTLVVRNDSTEERTLEYVRPEYNWAVEANPFPRGDRFEPGQSITYYLGPAPKGAERYELGPKIRRKDALYTGFFLRFRDGAIGYASLFIDCSQRSRTFDLLREVPSADRERVTIEAYCAGAYDRIAVVNASSPNTFYEALHEGNFATAVAAPTRDVRLRILSISIRSSLDARSKEFRRGELLGGGEAAVYYLGSAPSKETARYPHRKILDASARLGMRDGTVLVRANGEGGEAELGVTCREGVALFGTNGRLDGDQRVLPLIGDSSPTRDGVWLAAAVGVVLLVAGIRIAARRATS